MIRYDIGSGDKYHLGIGKTFFLNPYSGFRLTISGNLMQSLVDDKKDYIWAGIVEAGLVFYLL